jgi:ribosomal protein L12E/L44/L45/RPP1/RPP2
MVLACARYRAAIGGGREGRINSAAAATGEKIFREDEEEEEDEDEEGEEEEEERSRKK